MSYGSINSGSTSELTERQIKGILSLAHPVGSLYISDDATSPAELFGGTWERIEGRMIMGASDSYPVGTIGGSATHTQTVNEIASHYHRYSFIVGDAIPGQILCILKTANIRLAVVEEHLMTAAMRQHQAVQVPLWTSSTHTTHRTSGADCKIELQPYIV